MADEDLEWSDNLLRSVKHSAFRLETRSHYALGYEQSDFEEFLAGRPAEPPDVYWWRPWLKEIKRLASEGKTISRVRILDEPPSDYQRWEMWAARWHAEAGERIGYLTRSFARRINLPLPHDWWLLDDERVIVMRFNDDGTLQERITVTDRTLVARYIEWRDLAVRIATPAEAIAAA
jgi:hypothetical protein